MKARKVKKRYKFLKGEKPMYILLLFLLVLVVPIFNVFTSALLSQTNTEVERLRNKIADQELTNEGLSMQVDELSSLDNIQAIVDDYNLSYKNSNIKTVGEE